MSCAIYGFALSLCRPSPVMDSRSKCIKICVGSQCWNFAYLAFVVFLVVYFGIQLFALCVCHVFMLNLQIYQYLYII